MYKNYLLHVIYFNLFIFVEIEFEFLILTALKCIAKGLIIYLSKFDIQNYDFEFHTYFKRILKFRLLNLQSKLFRYLSCFTKHLVIIQYKSFLINSYTVTVRFN